MKCAHCNGPLEFRREDRLYSECGLDNILLKDAEIGECQVCHARTYVVPHPQVLNASIARTLALKPSLLTGKEIRFLRKHLGYSGVDYAKQVGVSAETVSRWENERLEMGWSNELLLRMTVLMRLRLKSYDAYDNSFEEEPFKNFEGVNKDKNMRGPAGLEFNIHENRWRHGPVIVSNAA
ncbi:helix-turn-helix domain-containing protein [Corallococcus interemptor]|uniref:Helix-turn-helix domain-containing protein n=1 Tax=Corallococcus interemptor TaxID=2316720 RepID=A0A3A8QMM1_9BACT|nr:helix-turn-helix domain-containing protein [Corallococcus interemptor]RKH69071.1 helix-turn-helix domain-containing protein [Corallococcus interemptor]